MDDRISIFMRQIKKVRRPALMAVIEGEEKPHMVLEKAKKRKRDPLTCSGEMTAQTLAPPWPFCYGSNRER